MTNDIYIGFRGKPEGLEAFLEENGYRLREEKDNVKDFEPKSGDLYPALYYWLDVATHEHELDEEEDNPWRGYPDVTSMLNINYHGDPEETVGAERIAQLVAKRFSGVYYTPWDGLYFEAEEL